MNAFADFCTDVRRQVDARLDTYLTATTHPASGLLEAMRYTLLQGGKRLRPILVFAAAKVGDAEDACVLDLACAIECIHAYSLIHDDLPAMDDDDLRRGHPTLHIAYDEATAILAGDALQAAAFELMAAAPFASAQQGLFCVSELASAAGFDGMAGGQFIDLQATGSTPGRAELESMHRLKTGALIRAAVRLGAVATGIDPGAASYGQLSTYGDCIGLAFQIKDDLLDVTGTTETLGKRSGADAGLEKPNFVSLLGVDGAQNELNRLGKEASDIARALGDRGQYLGELVQLVTHRTL